MIQAIGLTSPSRRKRLPRVDDLTFEARPGEVTVLLGPAGAGKSEALRLMLQLLPGRGVALFRGRSVHRIPHPAREIGVLLGDVPGHPARTARGHLRMLTAVAGVPLRRADDVLDVVGLSGLAGQRLGDFSQGMDRRLGMATALLGDPHTLVLDEPAQGLSPREASWLYGLLRGYAEQGGLVLASSRDPREAARLADRVVTIDGGRLVADQDAADFSRTRLRPRVAVRTPHAERFAAVLTREARSADRSSRGKGVVEVVCDGGSRVSVYGSNCAAVGESAYRHGILVHQLAEEIGDAGDRGHPGPLVRADGRAPGTREAAAQPPATTSRAQSAPAHAPAPSPSAATASAHGTASGVAPGAATGPAEAIVTGVAEGTGSGREGARAGVGTGCALRADSVPEAPEAGETGEGAPTGSVPLREGHASVPGPTTHVAMSDSGPQHRDVHGQSNDAASTAPLAATTAAVPPSAVTTAPAGTAARSASAPPADTTEYADSISTARTETAAPPASPTSPDSPSSPGSSASPDTSTDLSAPTGRNAPNTPNASATSSAAASTTSGVPSTTGSVRTTAARSAPTASGADVSPATPATSAATPAGVSGAFHSGTPDAAPLGVPATPSVTPTPTAPRTASNAAAPHTTTNTGTTPTSRVTADPSSPGPRAPSGISAVPARHASAEAALSPSLPAVRRPGPAAPVRYEVRRMFGVRTPWVVMVVALLVALGVAVLQARSGAGSTGMRDAGLEPVLRLLAAWPSGVPFLLPPVAVAAGLLGALAFGQEFRYPALAPAQVPVPRRLGLLVAKLVVTGGVASALCVFSALLNAGVLTLLYGVGKGVLTFPAHAFELSSLTGLFASVGDTAAEDGTGGQGLSFGLQVAAVLAICVGCGWAGLLAAGVFRSTVAGVTAVAAVPLLVVPAMRRLLSGPAVHSLDGLPERLRSAVLFPWPSGAEQWVAVALRVASQPVGRALALSLTVLLCAYVLTSLRSKPR